MERRARECRRSCGWAGGSIGLLTMLRFPVVAANICAIPSFRNCAAKGWDIAFAGLERVGRPPMAKGLAVVSLTLAGSPYSSPR
jgi:hypothetical protein